MDKSMVRVEKAMKLLKQKALGMDTKRNFIFLGYIGTVVLLVSLFYYHYPVLTVLFPPAILFASIYLFHQNYIIDKNKMLRQIKFMNEYFDRIMVLKARETFMNMINLVKEEFDKSKSSSEEKSKK